MSGNISVRQSPAYSSQAQGSVERFHRTLMGQIRTLRAQLQQDYDRTITSKHPSVPWLVRGTAYLLNRYATHADGNTSYFRRWNKDHRSPLCEFGETVQYLLPTAKQLPKTEQRFFRATWLGRDTATGETLLGISNTVIRARTSRRMPEPDKYDKQMFDITSRTGTTMTPPPPTSQPQLQPLIVIHPPRRSTIRTETQTSKEQMTITPSPTGGPQLPPRAIAYAPMPWTAPALANSLMATAPKSRNNRPAMTSRPKRHLADDTAEGSSTKQQWTPAQQEAPARPEPTPSNTRTTKEQTEDHKGYTQNKTRWGDYSLLLWRCDRTTNKTNPSRTHREQYRWTWQTEDNWRNEAGDPLHEATAGLHGSGHQHTDARATQEHYPVPLGPTRPKATRSEHGPSQKDSQKQWRTWMTSTRQHPFSVCWEHSSH